MNVVWELNVASIILIASNAVILTVFLFRASDRSIRAEKKADQALEKTEELEKKLILSQTLEREVSDAHACARSCKDQISLLNSSFSAYREMAAGNFISKEDLSHLESRLEKSVDKIASRVEFAIIHRGPVKEA